MGIPGEVRRLEIPWSLVARESQDRGAYLLLLERKRSGWIAVGKLGRVRFERGFYLYAGSAKANLRARLARHRRLEKKKFWHIDYLREGCSWIAGLPIRTASDLECVIAGRLAEAAAASFPGFGCSDCGCGSHLFRFEENPLHQEAFHDLLQHFRTDRLL